MNKKLSLGLAIFLFVGMAGSQVPMPKPRVLSPRQIQQMKESGVPMVKTTVTGPTQQLVVPAGKVVNLMADFAPITYTNALVNGTNGARLLVTLDHMTAFIEARETITTAWTRVSMPYYPGGGTMAVPWTNKTGQVYQRAGYEFYAPPPSAY